MKIIEIERKTKFIEFLEEMGIFLVGGFITLVFLILTNVSTNAIISSIVGAILVLRYRIYKQEKKEMKTKEQTGEKK